MKLSSRVSQLLLFAFVFGALTSGRAAASHHVFSSTADRFDADGNVFGPFDGTLDYVDEFDDGMVGPDWSPLLGTSVESGNQVTFQNPGGDITLGTTSFDVSNIENEDAIEDGMGNVTLRSHWLPVLPNPGAEFHMQLYGVGATIESAGLAVGNGTAGAYVAQQLSHIVYPSGFTNVSNDVVSINPVDITGQIILRMTVDDGANTATGSFSLDGGGSFQSPFPAMPIFGALSDYEVLLGAGVFEEVTPGPTPTPAPVPPQMLRSKMLLVKNGGGPTSRKVIYKGEQDLGTLGIPIGPGATFLLRIDGQVQCFTLPSSHWTPHLHGFTYADKEGTFGPVKSVKITNTLHGGLKVKAKISGHLGAITVIPPNPGVEAETNLAIGVSQFCGSSVGGTISPNTAKIFRVKNAPAPGACNLVCP
jgi:hypothetical protein